jgi:hypothetical protein
LVTSASADSTNIAIQLGNILGSEEPCGLSYDPAAIEAFIEKNVAADDMEFPGTLDMMTRAATRQIKEQGASAKTAHCSQVRRVAKANGFIKVKF